MINLKLTQFKKNIISGSLIHGLNIILTFISYPLYIHYIGFEQFSIWTMLSLVITVAQFGDFGIGKAIINYISSSYQTGDRFTVSVIIQNGLFIVILFSSIIQILLNFLSSEIILLLNIPAEYFDYSLKIVGLLGISIFSFLLYDCLASVLAGIGRTDLYNLLLFFLNFTKTILTVIILFFKPEIKSMIFGVLISNIFFIIIVILILFKYEIFINIRFSNIKKENIKKLLGFGLPIFGIQIVNIFMFPFIKIIVSHVYGISYVGYFELATKAAYSFRTFFEKGLFALLPEFSKVSVDNYKDNTYKQQLRKDVFKISKKLLLYSLPILILITLFSKLLLNFWLKDDYNTYIYYGFLLLQPGIFIGLIALPSYYALIALRKQIICFFESLIRIVLTILIYSLFYIYNIEYLYTYLVISITVIISNTFILYSFWKSIY